uniref:Potassium channel tetramerisation-type BTB domain-containing protein n=1 Tax=Pelusios castaneus TaxID=367368 RepID=A0A8C8VJ66_9SAUR
MSKLCPFLPRLPHPSTRDPSPTTAESPKSYSFKGGSLGDKYVRLNVGGSLYYTTVQVLTRCDTMLKAMFSGRMEVLTDKEVTKPWGGSFLLLRCE